MARAWRFENDVNTDEIIPGRYNLTTDPVELGKHAFCEVRPEFPTHIAAGDVVVAGENFGCGSSREHAPIALKGAGVSCVVAESFARIFFRNAVNIGLPILVCPEAGKIADGSSVSVDPTSGAVVDETAGETYQAEPLPAFVMKIVEAGGIVPFLQEHDMDELE